MPFFVLSLSAPFFNVLAELTFDSLFLMAILNLVKYRLKQEVRR